VSILSSEVDAMQKEVHSSGTSMARLSHDFGIQQTKMDDIMSNVSDLLEKVGSLQMKLHSIRDDMTSDARGFEGNMNHLSDEIQSMRHEIDQLLSGDESRRRRSWFR